MERSKRDIGKQVMVATSESQAPHVKELEQLITAFAPVLCFHSEEQYLPVSVDWYLQRTWLVNSASRTRIPAVSESLPQGEKNAGKFYLEPKEGISMFHDHIPAKTYIHAKPHNKTYTDLQYWFFYAHTGSASAVVKWLIDEIKGHEGKINLDPLGKSNGNWERITVRINNLTLEPEQVYFPKGGDGIWVPIEKVQRQGTQMMVYASRNSAALYPAPGFNCSEKIKFNLFSSQLEFCLQNETANAKRVDFSDACELVSADYLGEDKPTEPAWLNFQNNWGGPNPEYLTVSSIKRIVLSTFGKTLEFLLSRDILEQLVNYLLSTFVDACRFRSLAPKARTCWEGEEQ